MTLEAKTPASACAYKPTPTRDNAEEAAAAPATTTTNEAPSSAAAAAGGGGAHGGAVTTSRKSLRFLLDEDDDDYDASHVKGPLTRRRRALAVSSEETPGEGMDAGGGTWWGQTEYGDDDSDVDDLAGGGMGRAAHVAAGASFGVGDDDEDGGRLPRMPFSAARTSRGTLAGDGKCRCPVCQGEFERNDLVVLNNCNHPFWRGLACYQ